MCAFDKQQDFFILSVFLSCICLFGNLYLRNWTTSVVAQPLLNVKRFKYQNSVFSLLPESAVLLSSPFSSSLLPELTEVSSSVSFHAFDFDQSTAGHHPSHSPRWLVSLCVLTITFLSNTVDADYLCFTALGYLHVLLATNSWMHLEKEHIQAKFCLIQVIN